MSAFSPRQMFLLDEACKPIRQVWPDYGPVLVGTAQGPRGDRAPRDVDVRLVMEDERYDELAGTVGPRGMAFLGLAIGEYLASRTGLPIDFQLQRCTEANERHEGRRNPLGLRSLSHYEGDAAPSRSATPDKEA